MTAVMIGTNSPKTTLAIRHDIPTLERIATLVPLDLSLLVTHQC